MNRENHLKLLEKSIQENNNFDVIIIGGGITGAGIALGSAVNGLKTLLLEAKDFGYGTSGNSSKLVHGGLRYLQHGKIHITYIAVKERERLLKELPNLVWPIHFVLPYYHTKQKILYSLGLWMYDFFSFKKDHMNLSKEDLISLFPYLKTKEKTFNREYTLQGGYLYKDAQTDDSRLVIRTLKEAERHQAIILNYFPVKHLLIKKNYVVGVCAYDSLKKKEYFLNAKVVINATGPYVDVFREQLGLKKIIRPLRGSHIAFLSEKIKVPCAIGFSHPEDQRNVFVLPWFGLTVVGTTDLDHDFNLGFGKSSISEITQEEIQYLLRAIRNLFPNLHLSEKDIYCTWSGIRPVISANLNKPPSKESRDIYVEFYKNLLTVTGGKLTTFRFEAKKALSLLKKIFSINTFDLPFTTVTIQELEKKFNISRSDLMKIQDIERIIGFYGKDAENIIERILKNPTIISKFFISHSENCLYEEELIYSINNEWVENWEDLAYHRYRIGYTKKQLLPKIESLYNLYKT